jgi:hypothetical protein
VVAGALTVVVVLLVRGRLRGRVTGRVKFSLALASLALLIAVTALDWPLAAVGEFFSTHSVFTGMVTTVLLLGAGYFAWDSEAERRAEYLDDGLTAAGLGGLVETLADIDFILTALLTDPAEVARRRQSGKPLRWVRTWRDDIEAGGRDPRALPTQPPTALAESKVWRDTAEVVVTECLRRLSGGLRDWAPLLTKTPAGSEALVLASRARYDLMKVEELDDWTSLGAGLSVGWDRARLRVRFMALACELASGCAQPRWFLSRSSDDLLSATDREALSSLLQALPPDGATEAHRQQARRAMRLLEAYGVSA